MTKPLLNQSLTTQQAERGRGVVQRVVDPQALIYGRTNEKWCGSPSGHARGALLLSAFTSLTSGSQSWTSTSVGRNEERRIRRAARTLRFMIAWACFGALALPNVSRATETPPQSNQGATQTAPESLANLSVAHALSREEARLRVEQLLTYWSKRFGVKSEWVEFRAALTGTVWGVSIDAHFNVGDHDVTATASDRGSAWRRTAYDYVAKNLKKYLQPEFRAP